MVQNKTKQGITKATKPTKQSKPVAADKVRNQIRGYTTKTDSKAELMANHKSLDLWIKKVNFFLARLKYLNLQYALLSESDPLFLSHFALLYCKIEEALDEFDLMVQREYGSLINSDPETYVNPAFLELWNLAWSVHDRIKNHCKILSKSDKQQDFWAIFKSVVEQRYAINENDQWIIICDDTDLWGCNIHRKNLGTNPKLKKATYSRWCAAKGFNI